jgi:hypothetical protein
MEATAQKSSLSFGYNRGLIAGVIAAWGARWIVKQNGHVDQVHNRQDCFGPDDERKRLLDYLNTEVDGAERREAARLLKAYELRTDEDKEVTLYEDQHLVVLANPQASHGYLYVVAYFKPIASAYIPQTGDYRLCLKGPAEHTGSSTTLMDGKHVDHAIYEANGQSGRWSHPKHWMPKVGERVRMGSLGTGVVCAYFVHSPDNWFGVEVRPDDPPAWYVEQNFKKGRFHALLFGAEVRPMEE